MILAGILTAYSSGRIEGLEGFPESCCASLFVFVLFCFTSNDLVHVKELTKSLTSRRLLGGSHREGPVAAGQGHGVPQDRETPPLQEPRQPLISP